MEELTKISVCKKLYMTERPNSTDEILCKSLAGECKNIVIKDDSLNYSLLQQYKVIIISNLSKHNYTKVFRYCFENETFLLQLNHQDFEEEFDKETIYKLTSFNLELFRSKSIKTKINFIIGNNFEDYKPVDYSDILKLKSPDLNPKLLYYFYKTIAFNSKDSIKGICLLLNNYNNNELDIIYDEILKLSSFYDSKIIVCEKLINYYLSIRYSNHENKKIICSMLHFLYLNLDQQTIRKLNSCLQPLICYYTQTDKLGQNFSMLHELITNLHPNNNNHYTYKILTYSFVHNNETYVGLATNLLKAPENNIQQKFYIVMNKVKELQDSIKTLDIEPIHAVEGVDEYLHFLFDRNVAKEPSKFFNLLKGE